MERVGKSFKPRHHAANQLNKVVEHPGSLCKTCHRCLLLTSSTNRPDCIGFTCITRTGENMRHVTVSANSDVALSGLLGY